MAVLRDMLTHMKTTVEISDDLLERAKETARREGRTLRDLFEEALRDTLERRARQREPFRLVDRSVGGTGLQPGVDPRNWAQIRDIVYEGRGG
jgi:hypothetical protein